MSWREQDRVLPLPVQWQLSLCDLPIFNTAPGQGWLSVSVDGRLSGRLCGRERWGNVGFEHVTDESDTVREERALP